jgi:hypothetical protein
MKDTRIKDMAVDFLKQLRRERDERKFQHDMDDFRRRMDVRHDEIMTNFRKNINVK